MLHYLLLQLIPDYLFTRSKWILPILLITLYSVIGLICKKYYSTYVMVLWGSFVVADLIETYTYMIDYVRQNNSQLPTQNKANVQTQIHDDHHQFAYQQQDYEPEQDNYQEATSQYDNAEDQNIPADALPHPPAPDKNTTGVSSDNLVPDNSDADDVSSTVQIELENGDNEPYYVEEVPPTLKYKVQDVPTPKTMQNDLRSIVTSQSDEELMEQMQRMDTSHQTDQIDTDDYQEDAIEEEADDEDGSD